MPDAVDRGRPKLAWPAIVAALVLGAWTTGPARADESPIVAVASSVQFAMEQIAETFRVETGASVRLTFGSSGNFSRQIRQGAPFEMLVSADEDYILDLARDGFTRDEGSVYAVGRIVLIAANGSPLRVDPALDGLAAGLADGSVGRFAIANPEHAPYGRRAEEALRHRGLWDVVQPRLVLGENIAQAAQFAISGNAQGGIVAYSLAVSPKLADRASFALIPAEWHSPLRQRMALLAAAGPVAERFYDHLRRPSAGEVFRKYGFSLPDGPG